MKTPNNGHETTHKTLPEQNSQHRRKGGHATLSKAVCLPQKSSFIRIPTPTWSQGAGNGVSDVGCKRAPLNTYTQLNNMLGSQSQEAEMQALVVCARMANLALDVSL